MFEAGSGFDIALMIEMNVHGGMHAGELLQTSRAPKPEHSSLFSPEGEVRILRAVVLVATDLLAVLVADVFHCGAVGCALSKESRILYSRLF